MLFTNVTWDSAAIGLDGAFGDVRDRLVGTLGHLVVWTDVDVVVRIHPSEVVLPKWRTREPMQDVIDKAFPALPPHVRVVAADDPTSSYGLLEGADVGLVYTSTIGLELALNGLPTVVGGRPHYAAKGFTLEATDPTDHARVLDRVLADPRRTCPTSRSHGGMRTSSSSRPTFPVRRRPSPSAGWLASNPTSRKRVRPGADPGLDVISGASSRCAVPSGAVTAPREPRGLLSNTLASAAATFWVAALTVVSVPILIRLLGVSEYGVWILITVLAVQGRGLGSLLDLGLSQSVIQRVAATDDPDGAGGHVGAGVRLLAAVGVVAAAVIVACAPALVDAFSITTAQAAAVTAVRLLGLQLVVELPAVALGAGLEGLRRYEVKRAIDAGRATAFAVGAIVIAAGGGTVAGLALGSVVTTAATAAAFVVALGHFGVHPFRGGSARAKVRAGHAAAGAPGDRRRLPPVGPGRPRPRGLDRRRRRLRRCGEGEPRATDPTGCRNLRPDSGRRLRPAHRP